MKSLKLFALAAILAIAASSVASQSAVTQKLGTIYAKMDAMALKKDMPGLANMLKQIATPDCKFISKANSAGKTTSKTRDEAMAQMLSIMPVIDVISLSTSHIDKLTLGKGSALAIVSSTVAMTTKAGPSGPARKIVQKSKSADTWVNLSGSWKLKLSKILSETVTQDGKPVPTG
jgi:hypothetical protein